MKTVAIIAARLSSVRFPRKILQKIGNKTMLQHVIDNVNEAEGIDKVVVAIPYGQKIPFKRADKFEGKELNVLDRYYQCARKYKADIIIRITADCPLLTYNYIDWALKHFKKPPVSQYICLAPVSGFDVEVFSYHMLQEAWDNSVYREHVTPYMKQATKLSVDTPEDLEKVRKIYADLRNTSKN